MKATRYRGECRVVVAAMEPVSDMVDELGHD